VAIRQEQIVLTATVCLLGFLVYSESGDPGRRSSRGGGRSRDFDSHVVPDLSRVMPLSRDAGVLERELFSAPRDTRPLPPLDFEPPPLRPLQALRPSPAPGPEPRLFGNYLREDAESLSASGLFEESEMADDAAVDEYVLTGDEDLSLLSPEERMELVAAQKRLYDWIKPGSSLHFGQIVNDDRYGLERRGGDSILFLEFNPVTGLQRWPGNPAIEYDRSRIEEWAFADTVENRIELERLQFDGELTPGQYGRVIDFAIWCTTQRLETSRALEVAVEMYGKAVPLAGDDPTARLGLAQCHELQFDFELAFAIYDDLLSDSHSGHPLVLSRLARLEARFRMTRRAEKHFRTAVSHDRSSWLVQWSFGRFLLETDRPAEAIEHLRLAGRNEPSEAEYQSIRAQMRTDLGNALLATGELAEARRHYIRALQANSGEQRAIAGLLNVAYLTGEEPAEEAAAAAEVEGAGFELLLALGLSALREGDAEAARNNLELAAAADPLRAARAWRALSYLAETTGHEEEALQFIDQADQNDPTDVYTHIQRGRLLAQRDDLEGAMTSYTEALDHELELSDVLAEMGNLVTRVGRYEDAERFYRRSISIDDAVGPVHSSRGLNSIFLGRAREAEETFDRALQLDDDDPVASCGRAWCAYLLGDSTEAKTRFREFDDTRRHLGEEDSYRLYANAQIERIGDHEEKVVWSDRFERLDLRNGWMVDETVGPKVLLRDGRTVIEGHYEKTGRARLKREYVSGDFVSLEAKLTLHSGSNVRSGIFIALEQRQGRRSGDITTAEVTLSRNPNDGTIQYRSMRRGREDDVYVDSTVMSWPLDQPISLRLERFGESSKTAFRVLVDGVLIVERLPMPALGATTRRIWVGVFAEGDPGRVVNLDIDDIEIVKRERE
jgi:tetratricopeptide (TPR) repeat protein